MIPIGQKSDIWWAITDDSLVKEIQSESSFESFLGIIA